MKKAESNSSSQTIVRKELRNHATAAEATLWKVLKNSQVGGYKFRRQHGIGPYIMDFYCPLLKLCIELDGAVHLEAMADVRDDIRTKFLKQQGITVIRFNNDIVRNNPKGIIEEILRIGEEKTGNPAPTRGEE